MVKSVYVPEAGGMVNFADDITPQEMARYLDVKYPRAAAAAPAATSDDSGVLGRFAYGLATGITDIPGGIAALGLPAEKAAQSDAGKFSEGARSYLQGALGIDPTKDPTTAQMLAQGLGSAAGFLIPGGAAAKGAALLGKGAALAGESAALASRVGTATAAGQGAALGASQRAQTIQQQLASGMKISESEQLSSQQLSGLIGLSEALPMQKFFGPLNVILSKVPASKAPIVERIISSRIAKLTKAGTQEAAQEAASGIANDLMEYGVYNPDVQIGQDLLSNAAGGAFAGSVIEGVIQLAAGRKLRGARQLQADIKAETQQNAADLRQARIADAADKLRESGAEGTLTIEENEDPEGNQRFTVMNEKGDPLVDMYGIGQEGAAEAINIYKQNTGANVSLKIKETPKLDPVRIGGRRFPTIEAAYAEREKIRKHVQTLEAYGNDITRVSKEAALRGQQPGVLFKQIQDSLKTHRNNLAMFDRYFSVDVGPEPIAPGPKVKAPEAPVETPKPVAAAPIEEAAPEEPSPEFTEEDFTAEVPAQEAGSPDEPITSEEQVPEMPIGAVEMPVEESRVLPDEIVDSATGPIPATEPLEVKVEQRPSASDAELGALQEELFGQRINVRNMTPEQRALYDAERDKRFPPQDVDTYYAAGYAGIPVPKNLREAAINGPVVKDYSPETQKWMKDVYTRLLSQVENVVPDTVKLELKTLIDAPAGYLVRGQENAIETQYGIKSIVDLSTGVLKPGMTVDAAVKELAKTLNHEIIHVLRTKGVIRESEWRVLTNSVANTKVKGKAYTYLDKAEAVYTPIGEDGIARPISKVYENPDAVIEEAVADLYRDWIDGKVGYTSGAGLLNRIREFFRRIFQVLRNARHEEVFASIAKGEVGRRTDGVPRKSGERFSVSPLYNALDSTSDWETTGSPPPAISSVNRTGGSPFRISQRRPTAVKARGRSIGENLLVNVDAMKEDMAAYVHNVGILNSYPMFRVRPGEDVNDTLKRFKEDVVSNLLWLHDQMDPDLRKRAKLWYDGARKITDDLAKQYNLPDTSVAAVIATQSPQKDWFQNVSLAERVIDIMSTKQDMKFNNAMLKNALGRESMQAYAPLLNMMYGKKLKDLGKFTEQDFIKALGKNVPDQAKLKKDVERANKLAKAIFIRFYDEVYNPRTFYIITPEGNRGSVATTNSGDEQKVAWGTFDMISKGVQAFEDGSKENIDEVLGDQHKIRNFYNNIISPMSSDGSVTIDTHAVAAAHIRPLSGGSDEVHHNFGTSDKNVLLKTANSSVTGVQGLYAIYADAYREAAAKRGVLPREMQSITWEAVRGLYKPTFKAQAKNVSAIDAIWAKYKSGEINVNEVRNQILDYADPGSVGINNPFWRNEPDTFVYEAGRDSRDAGELGADVVGETTESVGRGATRRDAGRAKEGRFSAAPAVESKRFSAAPLPTYVEQQNETLFVKSEKVPFKNMIFDWAFGHHPEGKVVKVNGRDVPISQWTMTGVAGKAAAVDNAAFMTELEKTFNRETTGNYQRMQADYSATAAIAWLRRSSHIMASMMLRGNLGLNYDRPGDIMSATMKVQDDPDNLKEVFKIMTQPAYGDKTKADIFKTYAVAKRGEWLRSTGQTVPRELTPQYIREAIDSVQRDYPDVVEAYNMYQRFNKKLMTTVRDAGLISTAELGRLTNQMNYYGFIYEMYGEPMGPNSPQKAASQFKLRPYTGSQYGGLVNDPMFVMIQNAQFMVTSVAKNLAATKSLKLAELMGEARLLQTNEAPNEFQGEQPDVMFMSENGVVKRYAVKDPLMVTALGSDDRINVGKFWETLGLPAHILRESVTRDPGFMARNLMRDTVAAWMNSGVNFVPVIDTLKNFGLALKGGGSFKDLSARGVVGSYDLAMQTPKELSQTFRQNLPGNVHMPTSVEGLSAGVRTLWNRLGHVSEASDAATRMAVYDALIKEGMTEAEAAMQAIELLDFTRRGASQTLGILTKLIPFLNARIQGFDVLYQAGRSAIRVASGRSLGERDSRVGKKFLIRGAMLAAISVALEMLNQDDEDYAQIEDYVKNGNLLIPLKEFGLKGQFIAIPKPFENGLLFSTIPQQIYKTMTGEASARENVELFWGQLAGTFGVNPIPQALLPPIEIITNHNFFTGLPLISEGKARLAPELQYNTSTSQLAMMIGSLPIFYDFSTGRFGGASPIIIDKLISGYGGPVGTYFAQGIGLAMQDVANIGPERMPIELSNAPVVRSFFVDAKSKNPKVVTQAYELFRIADEANRTVSRLKQMNDAEALADYVAKNRDILTYKKYIFKLTDSLNKLSAQERAVERDTQMTREEKFAAQKKLREVRIQLASKVDMINQKIGR